MFIIFLLLGNLQFMRSQVAQTKGGANLSSKEIRAMAMAFSPNAIIYVGTSSSGVFASYDMGLSWKDAGLPGKEILALAVDKTGVLYAGTRAGLSVTRNHGSSWSNIDTGLGAGHGVWSLAISQANPKVIYIGTLWAGLHKSTDGGETWHSISPQLGDVTVNAFWVDPKDENRIIACVSPHSPHFVVDTSDGGKTWSPNAVLLRGSFGGPCNTIVSNPRNSSVVYLGSVYGAYRSNTTGNSWIPINGALTGQANYVHSIAIDPVNTHLIFRGTYTGGLWVSDDDGETWNDFQGGITSTSSEVLIATRQYLYVGTLGKGVFRIRIGAK